MDESVRVISSAVQSMYEAFPYPDYSLFVPLRWQEAYASTSLFSRQLLRHKLGYTPRYSTNPRLLIAGCGDIQTSILSHWEPRSHALLSVDLSARSLRKARLRSWMMLRPSSFQQANLEDPQSMPRGPFQHIDAYGVLHHLANPARALQALSESLQPGGTMRIMVYNSRARRWMFQLSRFFALLGLSAYKVQDLAEARRLLRILAQVPALKERLQAMQPIIQENARLVDAFFHAREARLGLSYWTQSWQEAGLEPLGLMDRYAELDDLKNPLITLPSLEAWDDRIHDLRFENNLELYLWKKLGISSSAEGPAQDYRVPFGLRRRLPPLAWFRYNETRSIPRADCWRLWQAFLNWQFHGKGPVLDKLCRHFSESALQRLSRLGVVFPDQFQSRSLKKILESPMQPSMDIPKIPEAMDLQSNRELTQKCAAILLQNKLPLARMPLIWQRLAKAQEP